MSTDHYTYRVTWSAEDAEHVGLCTEFPALSWLAATPEEALSGIRTLRWSLIFKRAWIATVSAKPRDRPMRNWALTLKPLAFLQSLTKMHALNPLGVTPWPL